MANNRGIRRGRIPFRTKTKRRPTRWNATNTGVDSGNGALNAALLPLRTATPAAFPPAFTLINGQVDVEPWADDQEVTLDRIVGNITLTGELAYDNSVAPFGNDLYVKLGILVDEEVADGVTTDLDLFTQETLEDYEWMWLWSGMLPVTANIPNALATLRSGINIPIDIRNRRKVGQSDELNIYGAYARYNQAITDDQTTSVVGMTVDLRQILMSR